MQLPKDATQASARASGARCVWCAGSGEAAPVPQGVGGEFRPVVAADELGVAAPLPGDLVDAGDGGVGVDGALNKVG
jgi:hypothetical protein